MTSHPQHLARLLTGLILPGGWRVLAPLSLPPAPPGGITSQGYLVESVDGVRAFLKALDYSAAFPRQELTPRTLQDPKDSTRTYTTSWFDMWRFSNGKADEHWDGATK